MAQGVSRAKPLRYRKGGGREFVLGWLGLPWLETAAEDPLGSGELLEGKFGYQLWGFPATAAQLSTWMKVQEQAMQPFGGMDPAVAKRYGMAVPRNLTNKVEVKGPAR